MRWDNLIHNNIIIMMMSSSFTSLLKLQHTEKCKALVTLVDSVKLHSLRDWVGLFSEKAAKITKDDIHYKVYNVNKTTPNSVVKTKPRPQDKLPLTQETEESFTRLVHEAEATVQFYRSSSQTQFGPGPVLSFWLTSYGKITYKNYCAEVSGLVRFEV